MIKELFERYLGKSLTINVIHKCTRWFVPGVDRLTTTKRECHVLTGAGNEALFWLEVKVV